MQKVLVLHESMLKDSKLKGSRLLVYAFLYSYSQIPGSKFYARYDSVCKFLGISKTSYFDALKWLLDNHYITGDYKVLINSDSCEISNHCVGSIWNKSVEETIKIAQYKWVK